MKRIISLILAVLTAALVLAGCRSTTQKPSSDTAAQQDTKPAETRVYPTLSDYKPSDPSYSGPINVSLESESYAIMTAPAYDKTAAAALNSKMPAVRELVDSVGDDSSLTVFGSGKPSTEAVKALETEINKLSADGHQVSLLMVDVNSNTGVSYHAGYSMASQSCIKAPYCGALIESNPDALKDNGEYLREAIEFSNNEAYSMLRYIYGSQALTDWCTEVGVDTGFAEPEYPHTYSAKDMFKLWTRLYCFLNGDKDQQNFAAYYADSACSAAKKQLGDRCPVQTKAGWECGIGEALNYDPQSEIPYEYTDGDPENGECGINDSGIVYTDKGPYLFVIYTNHPFGVFMDYTTPNPLYDITEALYQLQQSIQ